MKKEIAKYMDKCLICQKLIVKHQWPVGEQRPLEIPTLKSNSISMDFVIGLPLSTTKKNTI